MNQHRRRRTSPSKAHPSGKWPRTAPGSRRAWPLSSSSPAPSGPRPWPLDDRLWDVFRLDEDDSPECPEEGDFWIEADEEE